VPFLKYLLVIKFAAANLLGVEKLSVGLLIAQA